MTGARPADARPDPRSDADLIAAVRAGDAEAYGELYGRHVVAALRLARSLTSDGEADDLVSEAFAKVLVVLQRGQGPDTALRPYLLTAVRRLHVDRTRSLTRARPTDDIAAYERGEPFHDTAVAGFESGAAARAFASLPERWQLVLWHLEVEGHKPADVAPLLGMSANSVSALAYRAREGLRQAFVSMHAQDADDEDCARTRARLGAFIRNDVSKRDSAALESHLRDCRDCAGIYLELVEVNSDLRALIAPIVLGGAAAAYLGGSLGAGALTAAGGSGAGLLTSLGGFLGRQWSSHWGRIVAGATAAGVVVAGVLVGVPFGGDDRDVAAQRRTSGPAQASAPDAADPAAAPAPVALASPSEASTSGVQSEDEPAPDPGAESEPQPTDSPSGRPESPTDPGPSPPGQPGPTEEPAPTEDPDPTEDPTKDPTEDPTGDAAVASSAQPLAGGLVWDVTVEVTGLPPTEPGTLTVTLDRPAAGVHLDPRCNLVSLGRVTCHIEGPTTIGLLVAPVPGAPTILTAVLMPGDRRSSVQLG